MFDRTFFHIDEYGPEGLLYLPAVLCINRATVLWSPAPLLLKHANAEGKSLIGPDELLQLLRRGDIRVAGRMKWFERKWRQQAPWEFAGWFPPFDIEVLKILEEDQDSPLTERRVFVVPEEEGFALAEKALKREPSLRQKLLDRLERKTLPPGVLEKALRAVDEGRPPETQILRDAFNHQLAAIQSKAQATTVPDVHMATLIDIANLAPRPIAPQGPTVEDADAREALHVLRSITEMSTFRKLDKFLRSGGRTELITLLCSRRAGGELSDHLAVQIQEATEIKPVLERLFPRDPVQITLNLGSMAAIVVSLLASTPALQFGILPLAYTVSKEWGQRAGLLPLDVDSKRNVRQLFQIAFGAKRVTRGKVQAMLTRLLRPI